MNNILTKFTADFPSELDAAIIINDANRKYLTGFISTAGTLVVTRQAVYFIIDGRFFEHAKKQIKGIEIILEDNIFKQVDKLLSKHNAVNVGIESSTAPYLYVNKLKKHFQSKNILCDNTLDTYIFNCRKVKSEEEINSIKIGQQIINSAFEHMLKYVYKGVPELELAIELGTFAARHGCQRRAFSMIVTSGKKTSLPHGAPPDKVLENGDLVMIDMSCMFNGYFSDYTRTFAVNSATDEQKRIYDIVYTAQFLAKNSIKENVPCNEIDNVARSYIKGEGYGDYFIHNLGHGIGVLTHELPKFSPEDSTLLKEGNVLSVEPGIYFPGKFGIRLEDLIVVTKNGCEALSVSPEKLLVI